jgi:hypothetical protein
MAMVSRAKAAREGRRPSRGRKPLPREKRDSVAVGVARRNQSTSALTFAAQMKSFSLRPPTSWVE